MSNPFHIYRFFTQRKIQIIRYFLTGEYTWYSEYRRYKTPIGLRIPSSDHLECYVPSPVLPNVIKSCLPIFTSFIDRTLTPLHLIRKEKRNPSLRISTSAMFHHDTFYCFYTLPPRLHLSIILLSLILIICAALSIQHYVSGLHSYSLIHGLRSPIHWTIIFLSDLILCLLWLLILILIARLVHSSTFDGRFFALTPLYFIINLPFIYLIAKFFNGPILGATAIIVILQLAHILNMLKVLFELFRGYRVLSISISVLRWLLILFFPNINVFTLIVAILRRSSCPYDNSELKIQENFPHEHYPYKLLIHTLIFIGQFILYFLLLVIIDTWKLPILGHTVKGTINLQEEDNDVREERRRIEAMTNEEKQREALIVDNLSKRYHSLSIPAVNRLTFAVSHRQCFGLLGFNGSGMFRLIHTALYSASIENKIKFVNIDKYRV